MNNFKTIQVGKVTVLINTATEQMTWVSGMDIDGDGGLHTYHPQDTGRDALANAKDEHGRWVGLVTVDGLPFVRPDGYYTSTTSYQVPVIDGRRVEATDPRRYLDSEAVPFIVIPPQLIRVVRNIVMGCYCEVTYEGVTCPAMVGDEGNTFKIGEGSEALATGLHIPSNPRTGGVASGVRFSVFPGRQFTDAAGRTWPLQAAA